MGRRMRGEVEFGDGFLPELEALRRDAVHDDGATCWEKRVEFRHEGFEVTTVTADEDGIGGR